MRKLLTILAMVTLVVSFGPATPGGAGTSTTFPPNPGQLDALVITGEPTCTATYEYEVTWTLENVSDRSIAFLDAYVAIGAGSPDRVDLDLDPIAGGSSSTVVTSVGGSATGQYVLQTEAYFEGEEPYAGPVPGVVVLDGTCTAPTSTASVAGVGSGGSAAPTYTG